jgi:hypothetical protein
MLIEVKTGKKFGKVQEYLVKDGRKVVAKITDADQESMRHLDKAQRFLIVMNGCAFFRPTGRDAVEFVRSILEDRLNAFGGSSKVVARGLECFGA